MIYESIYGGFNSNDEVKQNIESYIRRENLLNSTEYTINDDLSIDVHGGLYLMNLNWTGRIPIRFGKIEGNVNIEGCNNLTNLKGFPTYVKGDIKINYNPKLESLEGCLIKETNGEFDCSKNKLTSLEFSPEKVNGKFDCSKNELTSLEGGPKITKGMLCGYNKLINLIGSPEECLTLGLSGNKLTSLEGIPKKVNSIIMDSPYLYSIDYFPENYRDDGRFVVKNGPLSLIYNESNGVFGSVMGDYKMETARLMCSFRMFVKGTNKIKLKNLKYFYHYLNEELTERDLNMIRISYEIV